MNWRPDGSPARSSSSRRFVDDCSHPRQIRLNHVAMSVPPELLDEDNRRDLKQFYEEVFGFQEHPSMTEDGQRLVFRVHEINQFLFLYGTASRCRARAWTTGASRSTPRPSSTRSSAGPGPSRRRIPRVHIVDKHVDEYASLAVTSTYIGYLLPMTIEIQWWDSK